MPPEFLVQQMQWREALDDATSEADIDHLLQQVTQVRQQALQRCGELLDIAHDPVLAVGQVRALMFIDRFSSDVQSRLDRFQDASALAGAPGQAT